MCVTKTNCCGCTACLQICPKQSICFQEDSLGFRYPHVDKAKCVKCGLCEMVCPVINQNPQFEPLSVWAAKHADEQIRVSSSSGGAFTFLAERIIDDGGVVFGAHFNANWEVVHDYTETKEGLIPFRGAKYVQSNLGNSYAQVEMFLKEGRKVMFTGTPCQIAGLKKMLRKEYNNLLTVDFVCHGVPSPEVWRRYLEEEIVRIGDSENTSLASSKVSPVITGVNFRDKSTGWKKYSFVLNFSEATAAGEQNTVLSSTFNDNVYMRAFLLNLSLRPSCYNCPAKAGKSGADITIGDFWGIENVLPDFDDNSGVSLLMINSKFGQEFISATNCILVKVNLNDALKSNSSYYSSVSEPLNRDFFLYLMKRKRFSDALRIVMSKNLFLRIRRVLFRKFCL